MLHRLRTASAVILPVVVLLLGASSVLGAGVGVSPGRMEFSVRPGGMETQELYVVNQNSEAADFVVYVEGRNAGWFRITPAEFTLPGKGHRNVEIELTPSIIAYPQEYDISVCVISMPVGSDLRIAAGIKVATHVQITGLPIMAVQWWIASVAIVLIMAAGVVGFWIRKANYMQR